LRLGLPISSDGPIGQNIREFVRRVETRTKGAIAIRLQGEDARYQEHEVVLAVASGAIEIGATTLNQFSYDVPLAAAFLQPFLFNFDALVEAATRPESEIRKLIDEEILYWTNTRVLWWQPYGSGVILSKKARITNPAAIAAQTVGAPDDQTRELIRACGSTPYLVAPPDVFAELEKGKIATAATDVMNVRERDLWRVADTITNLRYAPSLFLVVMNEKAWAKLAPEHQILLVELAQKAQQDAWARFAAIRAEAYAFAKQKGMSIVDLAVEDVVAWRACSAALLEAYVERAGDAGPKLFAAYGRLRTQPCCREAPGGIPDPFRGQ
jgi:C4-dicarboxylate-binding protein DctP